jgi:hypothetical protein
MFRNWRRPLSQPMYYAKPEPGIIHTLDGARRYIKALPSAVSHRPEWKAAAKQLRSAAWNGRCEAATRQLQLALMLHGALDMPPPPIPNVNTGKEWSETDLLELENALGCGATIAHAANFLGRSLEEVASKVEALGLKPAQK